MAPFREDRYDIAEEATIRFMTKIKYGVREGPGRHSNNTPLKEFNPKSLSTMLRYDVVYFLYRDQQKFEDNCSSLEEYFENKLHEENR